MKKIGIVTVGLLIAIASITVIAAVPPTPESYWGYATIDGVPAATDTPITVEITGTGEVVGNTTVVAADGLYSLNILFDDSETPEDEGATEGDNLTWKINGISCNIPAPRTDTASSGGTNDNFNIAASHPTPPAPTPSKRPRGGGGGGAPVTTPTPTVTPTPTPIPTATPTPRITSTPEPIVLGFPVYAVSYVYILLAVLLILVLVVTIMLLRRRKKRGGRNKIKEGSNSLKNREMGE